MKRIAGVTDLTPARWVQDALPDFGKQLVGSIIPGGFEAYVRILHPATDGESSTWRDIAAANGRALEPLSHWDDIAPSDQNQPWEGKLADAQVAALVPILAAATTTASICWFAVWAGWGGLTSAAAVLSATADPDAPVETWYRPPVLDEAQVPFFRTPHREYFLLRGAVEHVPNVSRDYERPALWWPDDHAWFVASEIDLTSTYVGGTNELIEAIVDAPALEAVRVDANGGYA